jgi:hypothetical protein
MKGIRDFIESEGLAGTCDLVSLAGAGKNLADPASPDHQGCLETQIRLSSDLHSVSEVIFMNHLDCGAYGGRAAFSSDEEERTRHVDDLKKAAGRVKELCPDLPVRLVIASLTGDGDVAFEDVV